jgi:flagellar hook protein FlgE
VIGSLFTAITGLQSFQQDMNVVANDIANVNTIGFKSAETTFESLLSQTLQSAAAPTATTGGSNPKQIGLGVQLTGVTPIFTQGSAETTGKPTDLMIQGAGFFVLNNAGTTYYTRDGAFDRDANGNIVNPSTGMMVMGYQAQGNPPDINTNAPLAPINIPSTYASFNISSNGTVTGISSTGTTTVLGQVAIVSFPNPSGLQAAGNNLYLSTLNSGTPNTTTANVTFAGSSPATATAIMASTSAVPNVPSMTYPATVTAPSGVTVYGTYKSTVTLPVTNPTSLNITLTVNTAGTISATAAVNGTTDTTNPTVGGAGTAAGGATITYGTAATPITITIPANALVAPGAGTNTYTISLANGNLGATGIPGTNGLGTITPGALEMSNVDLSREFSNMIIAERGFQANSKTITTSDEILMTLVNMKAQG